MAKRRRRGQNFIVQGATIEEPGQRGTNITMCEAISEDGLVGCRPFIGSYNAGILVAFLDKLTVVCRATGMTYDPSSINHYVLEIILSFLKPIEEFFPLGAGKCMIGSHIYRRPLSMPRKKHARRMFPRGLTRENIHCDVDENLWPMRVICNRSFSFYVRHIRCIVFF